MSSKESRLLSASKTFDQGLSRHHLSSWDSILDPHVTLHKDAITLYDDLNGISTVKGYFQASSTQTFSHRSPAHALDASLVGAAAPIWT